MKRSVVLALVFALLPFSASPSSATPATCYVVENGVLTNGSACSGDVVIDSSVTSIGDYNGYGAFHGTGVTSVTIPSTVETIGYGAFWYAGGLTSVTFAPGSTLTSISLFAFADTSNLKTITLPSSLISLSSVAFQDSGIQYIIFDGTAPGIVNYNSDPPGNLQGVSSSAIAWVKPENLATFSTVTPTPTILPNIRSLTGSTPPPTIFSPADGTTLTATVGDYFFEFVNYFGVGTPILEISSGSLPPGVTLNANTGLLSGIPTTTPPLVTRTYQVSLSVRDGAQSDSIAISFEIQPPRLPFIDAQNFSGYVGIAMNKSLNFFPNQTGTITLFDGSLPPGISINSANRIIGTPTTAGTYIAKLRVTDPYSQAVVSDDFVFVVEPPITVSISASRPFMNPTSNSETPLYSEINTNAPNDFIICGFYRDAKDPDSVYRRDNCETKQWSDYVLSGITSNENNPYFENTIWVIRAYGPDARAAGNPVINTPFLATVTLKVSQEDLYRNWLTPLPAVSNGPKIGDTVHASAFERELPTLLAPRNYDFPEYEGPSPEEYVYRITKQPNVPATSVDHQPHDAYMSLSPTQQDDWYTELGFGGQNPQYQFTWKAFMCVNQEDDSLTKPTNLNRSYASRDDGVLAGGSFNSAHNTMFKNAAIDWHQNAYLGQTIRSAVGSNWTDGQASARYFLGEGDPDFFSHIWGFVDIGGSCGVDDEFQALTIRNANGSAVTTKSFAIPDNLFFDLDGPSLASVNSTGVTIGVTGVPLTSRDFNAALWGLTTIADSNVTTPPTTPPTTMPSASPSASPSATPIPSASPTTNAPAKAVSKSTSSLSNTIRFSTSSKVLTLAHKNALTKSVKTSGKKASYVITGVAGFLPGVTETQVKRLAMVRANIVKNYLVRLGVNKANITIKIKTTNQGIVPKTKILARYLTS